MEFVKCGKKGQITIPRGIMKQLGIAENTPMIMDVTEDGAIVLRQAAVVPIEIYSEQRLAQFDREGQLTTEEIARARAILRKAQA